MVAMGAQYRIGNVYEYALMMELQRVVPRTAASSTIITALREMKTKASFRINQLRVGRI